jgi:hypothetical protein
MTNLILVDQWGNRGVFCYRHAQDFSHTVSRSASTDEPCDYCTGEPCQNCQSHRLVSLSAKVSDMLSVMTREADHTGYVPADLGIRPSDNDADYVYVVYCADCGQMQGDWPLPPSLLETTGKAFPSRK